MSGKFLAFWILKIHSGPPASYPGGRIYKLGPCRTWAAGWLHRDPIGRSGLRSRIENRRFLKENGRDDMNRDVYRLTDLI